MKLTNIGASHNLIKDIKKGNLRKRKLFVIDDLSVLEADYCKSLEIESVIVCSSLIFSKQAFSVREYYLNTAKECFEVSEKVFLSICEKENCAGIMVVAKKPELDLQQLKNSNFVLVNDGIEMAGNLGTIFRSCDATAVDLVVNTNVVANPYSEKVLHSSRGMVLKVPFVNADIDSVINALNKNNFKIILCETLNGVSFVNANYSGKIAIVIGSERFGINDKWLKQNTTNVFIDMFGEMKSLNVGVAGSVVLYQAKMQRESLK